MPVFKRAHRDNAAEPARIEDVLSDEVLSDPMVDRDALNELLKVPVPHLSEPDDDAPSDEGADQESALRRGARLAGLVTAVTVLTAAVVAAILLDRERDTHNAPPAHVAGVTGVRALAIFDASESPTTVTSTTTPPASPSPQQPQGATLSAAPEPRAAVEHATSGPTAMVTTAVSPRQRPEELAADFYRLIGSQPDGALDLLSADLRSDPGQLVAAWNSVTDLDVHTMETQPDGAVRAVLTLTRADSDRYRVVQLLEIDEGARPLITGARLLSSQHSAHEK